VGADTSQTIGVVAGGDDVDPDLSARLPTFDYVIAADSGLHAALRLGLTVDLIVGDLDSVDRALLERSDAQVDRHPAAKDQTDIVLALDRAHGLGASAVVVVSGGGGRLDHALANLLVLAAPRYADMRISAHIGDAAVAVVRDRWETAAPAGTVVSLFAVDGPARVTTDGLRYALRDDVLTSLSSRGVSNEYVGGPAAVTVREGTVLAIRPGGERRHSRAEDGAPHGTNDAGAAPGRGGAG
jgi:thiamine pyrophosphokinase